MESYRGNIKKNFPIIHGIQEKIKKLWGMPPLRYRTAFAI